MPNDPNIAPIAQGVLCVSNEQYNPPSPDTRYANACHWEACESTDESRAIELYERAIALNHTESMVALAKIFLRDGDYANAVGLYERAIALGDSDAMEGRAKMHEAGQGGAKNRVLAYILYEQAYQKLNSSKPEYYHNSKIKPTLDLLRGVQLDILRSKINEMSNHYMYDASSANTLLNLQWDDLIHSRHVGEFGIQLLKRHCRAAILERLVGATSSFRDNFERLSAFSEPRHVLARALGSEEAAPTVEYMSLLSYIRPSQEVHALMLLHIQPMPSMLSNKYMHLLSTPLLQELHALVQRDAENNTHHLQWRSSFYNFINAGGHVLLPLIMDYFFHGVRVDNQEKEPEPSMPRLCFDASSVKPLAETKESKHRGDLQDLCAHRNHRTENDPRQTQALRALIVDVFGSSEDRSQGEVAQYFANRSERFLFAELFRGRDAGCRKIYLLKLEGMAYDVVNNTTDIAALSQEIDRGIREFPPASGSGDESLRALLERFKARLLAIVGSAVTPQSEPCAGLRL